MSFNSKEYHKKYHREWYLKNKEKRNKQIADWVKRNKKRKQATNKRCELKIETQLTRKKYRDSHKYQAKQYRLKNKKRINKQIIDWTRNKLKTDIGFKLLFNLRRRLNDAIKGNNKSKRTLELLGCSIEELKKHLELQFQLGMTWENYGIGGWEIDHIKQCCTFNLLDSNQQKECFHYTNLRPLWASDNRSRPKR